MIIVIVVFKVRGVSVQQHVTVVIETVKYPKPHHGAKPGAQRLVREGRVVERHAFVRDPMTLARCVVDERRKQCQSKERSVVVVVVKKAVMPSRVRASIHAKLIDRRDAPTTTFADAGLSTRTHRNRGRIVRRDARRLISGASRGIKALRVRKTSPRDGCARQRMRVRRLHPLNECVCGGATPGKAKRLF